MEEFINMRYVQAVAQLLPHSTLNYDDMLSSTFGTLDYREKIKLIKTVSHDTVRAIVWARSKSHITNYHSLVVSVSTNNQLQIQSNHYSDPSSHRERCSFIRSLILI